MYYLYLWKENPEGIPTTCSLRKSEDEKELIAIIARLPENVFYNLVAMGKTITTNKK